MVQTEVTPTVLEQVEELAARLALFPFHRMTVDYDAEVDCLYLSFPEPQSAGDSEELQNGMILRYSGEQIVGITILDASTRGAVKAKHKKVKA